MSEDLFRRLKGSTRLPSPPGVALRVLELARSDDASLEDLQKTISSDPALSSRILKFVNSPAAGLGRSTASLEEAVNHIGLRSVQLMALSFSLVASPKPAAGREEVKGTFSYEAFWTRSLACAVAAKVLALQAGRIDPNEAFISGLLLHIGQLALTCAMPVAYEELLRSASGGPGGLPALEKEKLGSSHLEVSCWLLQQWNLPEGIWHAIGGMPRHAEGTAEESEGVDLARVLHLADVAAQLLSDSREERAGKAAEILSLVRAALGIDEAGWTGIYDQIVAEWKAYGQLLSVKAGTELSFADLQAEAQEQMTALSMATQKESAGIKQQNQKLQEQARVDVLTALSNRAAFNERLKGELERARRTERPLVLFMIDVDHFKAFNDTYGHQVGDRVLQLVAGAIRGAIRTMDFAARYGGEEFAVIAPECAPEGATVLGERLRGAVEKTVFTILGKRLQVTVSIGAGRAQWPAHAKSEADLIGEADAMLYEAKHAGRNCYRAAPALQQAA